jgi:hypothetical protein
MAGMRTRTADGGIPAVRVAVIPSQRTHGRVALENSVRVGRSPRNVHAINRSGGNESGEVEEGEQKNETRVDRHGVRYEIETNVRIAAAQRGRTGLKQDEEETAGLNRARAAMECVYERR